MTDREPTSPWHRGERILQEQAGVAERMAAVGRKVVRDFMPDQHRAFFAQLPFLVVGAVGADGAPWAGVLEGEPGFVSTPDARSLRVDAAPAPGDPLAAALSPGAAVGTLGIELHTRRRNRANGLLTCRDAHGFALAVQQSFGNCPQYIQLREPSAGRDAAREPRAAVVGSRLDGAARTLIELADTFFVASYLDDESGRSVDVSHRGGKPGFVRIDGDVLTIPDFAGNMFFNTLGNLLLHPRAGLCFLDFVDGHVLQLTGATELVLQGAELASFDGAQRLWRFQVQRVVWRAEALGMRLELRGYSPFSLRTGEWPRGG